MATSEAVRSGCWCSWSSSFLSSASSALRDIFFFFKSQSCGETHFTSLLLSGASCMEEAAVEDKEERKNDDVKETSQQQATETETSIARAPLTPLTTTRLLFSPTRDGDFVLLAKIPHPRPG